MKNKIFTKKELDEIQAKAERLPLMQYRRIMRYICQLPEYTEKNIRTLKKRNV